MCETKRSLICVCALIVGLGIQVAGQQPNGTTNDLSDRERDGLIGPVRRLTVESAKIIVKNGNVTEGPRALREVTTYDPRGKKIDSVAYPIDGEILPGKEIYKYDDKGNIVEMQLKAQDGRLLSKELYKYQLDEVGNWKKMTTSLAVFQDGSISEEPVEVTYRTITYFYNQEIAKLVTSPPVRSDARALKSNEVPRPQTANPQPKGMKTVETPASPKPTFNTLTANASEVRRDNSSRSTTAKPTILDTAPVPLSQKLSSTAKSEDIDPPASMLVSEENAAPANESPSGVTIGNKEPADTRAASPSPRPASDAKTLYNLGVSHLEAGKPAEAIVTLNESIHKDPENAVAYLKLGSAYCATQQYTEAIAVYKMAIEIKREVVDAESYYNLGQAYTAVGKPADALAALKQALYISRAETLNAEGPRSRTAPSAVQLHYTLGSAYHRLSKFKEAIQELRIVIDLNPRIAEAHFGLAVCYISLGDRKSAEKEQKILATLNPALAQKIADALSNSRITPPGVTEGMFGKR